MATTYLALLDGTATGDTLTAASWNKVTNAIDRGALTEYSLWGTGRKSGWGITSGASTVATGGGLVGGCWCATAASQAISGLSAGTRYVFARADAGSPASGTIGFVARATSATVTNADGVTEACLLGKGVYVSASGFTSVDSSIRDNWVIDHGGLSGLTDDDHPQYMQDVVVSLFGADAIVPATSAASTSTFGTNFPATAIKLPALSTTRGGWDLHAPADYSGAITVYTEWLSSGLAGNVRLDVFGRCIAGGETWDAALTSCLAGATRAISGTNGQLMVLSHSWTATLPAAGERCSVAVRRDGANASDTMSGTARLLSARAVFATAL